MPYLLETFLKNQLGALIERVFLQLSAVFMHHPREDRVYCNCSNSRIHVCEKNGTGDVGNLSGFCSNAKDEFFAE
jgi:hypothetical protein